MTVRLNLYTTALLLAVVATACRDDTTAPRADLRAVAAGSRSLIDDTQAPVLVSLSFSPTSVDVSGADAQVAVTAHITDDLAGVKAFQFIQFRAPTTAQYQVALLQRSAGTVLDGTYVGTITVPRFSEAGDWYVDRIELIDEVGNWNGIYTDALNARGINTILQVASIEDIHAPSLVSLSFTPTSIDVSLVDVEVAVTARITDGLAGANDLQYIQFRAPTTTQYAFAHLKRTSGSANDGIYTGTFTIPRSSEGGDWRIDRIELIDVLGNYRGLDTDALRALGINTILHVTSVQDVQAPTLVSLSFAPTEVDVSASDAQVEVTAHIKDDLTGANEFQYIQFVAPSTTQYQFALLKRSSGTPNDGIYTGTVIMPRFSEGGAWRIERVELTDVMGNWSGLFTETMRSMGFNTILMVIGQVPDVPVPTIANLIAAVRAMGLPNGVTNSLLAPIKNIESKSRDACDRLRVFITHVDAKARNGQLTASQADELLGMANAIVESLGCARED